LKQRCDPTSPNVECLDATPFWTSGRTLPGNAPSWELVGTDYQFAYQYDTLGRLEQILNVQNSPDATTKSLWYQYAYDAASNQIQRYCPINGVAQNYQRDELGRVKDLTIQNATAPQYGNVPSPPSAPGNPSIINYELIRALVSGVTGVVKPPGILAGLTNLTGLAGQTVPTIGTIVTSEHYLYDAMSRVTNVQRDGHDDGFGYDCAGQLTTASYTGWNGGGTRNVNYSQDNLGNRNQVNDNGGVQGYSHNSSYLNQYVSAPAGSVSNGTEHEIAGYEGPNYTHYGDRRLASVSGNGNSYGLAYDALGRCVKRTLNGTVVYYTYDGPHPIYEWKADGSKAGWNLYGKGIDEVLLRADYQVVSAGQGYFFQQNRLGSVTHLTGFSGEVIESYRYDAFGQPTTTYSGGSFNNRFKFTGREYQSAFGIYEYRNRAYHPGLGRFLSEDPMGLGAGDSNMFRYCGGDPVNRRDPFGLHHVSGDEKIYFTEDINPGSDPSPAYNPDNNSIDTSSIFDGTSGSSGSGSGISGPAPGFGPGGSFSGGGGGGGDKGGLFGPVIGGNGLFGGISGSRISGGGGGGAPLNLATMLKTSFYSNYGPAFENALRDRAGYVLDIPPQTLANSPELILGYSDRDLNGMSGHFFPIGWNQPERGPLGTIYIANGAFRDPNPTQPYRTYAHELANIVDQRIYQSSDHDPRYGRHWGDPHDRHDDDSGQAVALVMFGPNW
jgi:RHS repeat-associated protein